MEDDENTKEENQPSTSKKETRTNSANDLYNDDRQQDDRASNSETSVSATYSARSRIEMANTRPEPPKPVAKREAKAPERKKRARRQGRVEKRRRSYTRRQVRRATIRRRARMPIEKKERNLSVSTIFTRLSSRSGSRTPGCIHCGHRCCRRSVADTLFVIGISSQCSTIVSKDDGDGYKLTVSISTRQIVLHSTMNGIPYLKVTPDMIVEGLRALITWKQNVQDIMLMNFIKRRYPVNSNDQELLNEIQEKLRIAAIVEEGSLEHRSGSGRRRDIDSSEYRTILYSEIDSDQLQLMEQGYEENYWSIVIFSGANSENYIDVLKDVMKMC
ncbi:unnamed protein product [Spodoptera exigua]|nr:unnamed protein product [Spodoptera exigua]